MNSHEELPHIWEESVRDEWCDYNDHLNVAYYILIFDHATDAFYDSVRLDEAYRAASGCSTFAVEMHTNYIAEVRNGAPVYCTTQLLDYDEKRMHYFHRMFHAEEGYLAATTEVMAVHVDMSVRRVAAMPQALIETLGGLRAAHADIPAPAQQGSVIAIRRK